MDNEMVIGIDYGTDSVESLLVDAKNGSEIASSVFYYPRWKSGKYCKPAKNQFRQHPLDYVEGIEHTFKEILAQLSSDEKKLVKGISVDTTGSTPVAVDASGHPLALQEQHQDNPNAMFILWKDHTAIQEAEEINKHATQFDINYLQYVGGIYSSEWFWAKILHTLRADKEILKDAVSWVEHCDWIPHLLTGGTDVLKMKRSRCAAGHKALWHESYNGLPPEDFWSSLDPLLNGLRANLFDDTYTSDVVAGNLSADWADKFGLSTDTIISVGAFDAHMGAVGGEIKPYTLSRIMGTSTCDILIAPMEVVGSKLVKGICGQVDGSVVPDMLGLEAGQSAFGDVYSWFRNLLSWTLDEFISKDDQSLADEIFEKIIPRLNESAGNLKVEESNELALDWMNGRRTPDANQALKGALMNINLGSDAPRIFKSLVESTCFGARAIVERFKKEGIEIKEIVGLGGVAKKSPFVMQTLADVLNMPIRVAKSEQTCALGAAMFAAVAARIYPDVLSAQSSMGQGFESEYLPRQEHINYYNAMYQAYLNFGDKIESLHNREMN